MFVSVVFVCVSAWFLSGHSASSAADSGDWWRPLVERRVLLAVGATVALTAFLYYEALALDELVTTMRKKFEAI